MSTAAGTIGYQRQGVGVTAAAWGTVMGLLGMLVAAALVAALFTAPAQPSRFIDRRVPIGRVAPAPQVQAAELGAVLSQGPAFTSGAERALSRATWKQSGNVIGGTSVSFATEIARGKMEYARQLRQTSTP